MPDLLDKGSAWLKDQRQRHMTQKVTYARGADTVSLDATIGKTEFEQADQFGVIHRIESRDYLFPTADLILAGEATLPRAGDRVFEKPAGITFTYEVMAPGSEPPFRYSDAYRRTLRVHTKLIATEGP